ncbi:MAG: aminotransferase class I/II-fold pyridoxal phosphate-dependent enzyme [Bacillota bacterium]|nr:aminotransferase class I/II-fold pyridoxal phosphate-dependent enzyme [Bacillota bacterium]
MSFVKDSVNRTPIVDTVFAIVAKAAEAKAKFGADAVVDATIGSLYGEDGKLVALDCVFESLKSQDNRVLAKYAASFTGNADFRSLVHEWVVQGNTKLPYEVIATPGGTGAVGTCLNECLDAGQTVILPEVAWGSYNLMAQMDNLNVVKYSLFDGDKFNIASLKESFETVKKTQDRIVFIINDPCHNPTGYSLSNEEWAEVVALVNETAKTHSVVIVNDIAYMDFAYGQEKAREYMKNFDNLSDNAAVVVCFSISKSMTSYGLRCGAAIIMSPTAEAVNQIKIVFEKAARATWSNINNGAMAMFVDVLQNRKEEYDKERMYYVNLLQKRSSKFVEEAAQVGLKHYPYKEGFFVTLSMDNDTRDVFHEKLMAENIFTVKVNKGIRVAVCSLPYEKVCGLAKRMKDILDTCA